MSAATCKAVHVQPTLQCWRYKHRGSTCRVRLVTSLQRDQLCFMESSPAEALKWQPTQPTATARWARAQCGQAGAAPAPRRAGSPAGQRRGRPVVSDIRPSVSSVPLHMNEGEAWHLIHSAALSPHMLLAAPAGRQAAFLGQWQAGGSGCPPAARAAPGLPRTPAPTGRAGWWQHTADPAGKPGQQHTAGGSR